MIRYQQVVFPLCTEIQLSVIAQFGFQPDGEGIIQVNKRSSYCCNFNQHVLCLVYTAHQNNGEGGSGNCQTRTTRQELFHPSDAPSTERKFSFQALVWSKTSIIE